MSDKIIYTSDAKFDDDVIKSDIPVLLDLWAPWCGPCRAIAPILDDLAEEFNGKVKIVKLNIDENQKTPASLGVRSIPTLIVFKDGKAVATQVGALPKAQLTAFIEKSI
ncbi:thioredoxin [Mergibacter septicus]|uniref:Thioredoxin n=2 Tax=Mergibacter septicus TaxID=221402 RepID=A0A8D4LIS3_9PAST|nr:thioredoxin [Mergibacter septicus]AWX14225.1 thioredoxin [Mergibacter septicus]AWX16226.1 thioredoxin [Mergibacter septicus]QDJ13685.1 thioredoxin [Mergibacter septicus]QDJ15478.1 thioredoxin [Mergibacter septicus]UTU48652.1 thioredoxin [Mergibacter septicus]